MITMISANRLTNNGKNRPASFLARGSDGAASVKARRCIGIVACTAALLALFAGFVIADESKSGMHQPITHREKAANPASLAGLTTPEVFRELRKPDYLTDRALSRQAVESVLGHRRSEAIDMAADSLKEPLIEVIDGQWVDRSREFAVARLVIEAFPGEAAPALVAVYRAGDGITRGNIVRVAGGIDGGPSIESMLRHALDDRSAAEEALPEQSGESMRVCDLAYNQIIHRNNIRKLLRTISPNHTIATRDHHIEILRGYLNSGKNPETH